MKILILLFASLSVFNIYAKQSTCLESLSEFKNLEDRDSSHSVYIQDAFTLCLGEYIRIKTISPNGNEEQAAKFLADIFKTFDIPYMVYTTPSLVKNQQGELKYNFIATLPADLSSKYDWSKLTDRPSIILTHHMDVVDVQSQQWWKPELAFSGVVAPDKEGELAIWGRGALDMKGIGMAHLFTMILMQKRGLPLKHDIHFLALADEEEAGSGAIGTLELMKKGKSLQALRSARILLNEGGGGIKDVPVEGVNLTLVSTEQKGGAWLELKHNDPMYILKKLDKMRILDLDYKKLRSQRVSKRFKKCELISIKGPEPKANVVVSKISLEFNCKDMNQEQLNLFKTSFTQGFDSVHFEFSMSNLMRVDIETSSSSHGSVGLSLSALDVATSGLYRLRLFKPAFKVFRPRVFKKTSTDATAQLIETLKHHDKTLKFASKLQFIPFVRNIILKEIEKSFGVADIFGTSCILTNLNYSKAASTSAIIDCRLLTTYARMGGDISHTEHFISVLKKNKYFGKEIKFNLISGWNYSSSNFNTKEFKAIKRALEFTDPKSRVTPFLNPAGSDNAWFRNPDKVGVSGVDPIMSFGLFPGNFNAELVSSMHGSNERFPVSEIVGSVDRFLAVVDELDKLD